MLFLRVAACPGCGVDILVGVSAVAAIPLENAYSCLEGCASVQQRVTGVLLCWTQSRHKIKSYPVPDGLGGAGIGLHTLQFVEVFWKAQQRVTVGAKSLVSFLRFLTISLHMDSCVRRASTLF